jgi:CheY-like chemotaxis protein
MAKILIIDDDVEIREALGKFLRRQGYEVITAHDGQAGLTAALDVPDLIICDLGMPVLNGHGVLEALRRDKRMEDIPFVFLSGSANREMIRQSMNLGGDDFIPKPAELPEILETVNFRLLRRQRQLQRRQEEIQKAVQIFSGIVNDLGSPSAAMQWLAEAASSHKPGVPRPGQTALADAGTPAPASFLANRDNRQYFVKLSEVKALLADGEYSKAFWGKDQHMMFRKALKQWESELPAAQFIRVHRKAIINLSYLDFVDKHPSGQPQVHLKDFSPTIEVSQRKVSALNSALKSFRPVK